MPGVGVAALRSTPSNFSVHSINGPVAVFPDAAQDLGHGLVHIGAGISRAREEVIEGRLGPTEIEHAEGHEDPRLLATRDPSGRTQGIGRPGGPRSYEAVLATMVGLTCICSHCLRRSVTSSFTALVTSGRASGIFMSKFSTPWRISRISTPSGPALYW